MILGGSLTDGDPSVVAVNNLFSAPCDRAGLPTCTGTLIGPDLVLTAAHCVDGLGGSSLGIIVGATADLGQGPVGEGLEGVLFPVLDAWAHPDYAPTTLDFDVGLIRLESPLDAPISAVALSLDTGVIGQTARVVGYGGSDTPPPFRKRQGTVLISELADNTLTYTPEPSLTCSGDSGGPVFLDIGGVETLVAVTSSGDPACETHGTAIRVDVIADFLAGAR